MDAAGTALRDHLEAGAHLMLPDSVTGAIGAAPVFKAVYVNRREIKCACVGGLSKVPLGFVSPTEDLVMAAMAV